MRKIVLTAHSRIHVGTVSLGSYRQRLGIGVGFAINRPRTVLQLEPGHGRFEVAGPGKEAAEGIARELSDHYGWTLKGRLIVLEKIPEHVGLGSGTQFLLSCATILGRAHGVCVDLYDVVQRFGRSYFSGVGLETFRRGGLVIDGGYTLEDLSRKEPVRLLFGLRMPRKWRFLCVLPGGMASSRPRHLTDVEGQQLDSYTLDPDTAELSARILLDLAPAVRSADFANFSRAVSRIGEIGYKREEVAFYGEQLGVVSNAIGEMGIGPVCMSSSGPTLYVPFCKSDTSETSVLRQAKEIIGYRGSVWICSPCNSKSTVRSPN